MLAEFMDSIYIKKEVKLVLHLQNPCSKLQYVAKIIIFIQLSTFHGSLEHL